MQTNSNDDSNNNMMMLYGELTLCDTATTSEEDDGSDNDTDSAYSLHHHHHHHHHHTSSVSSSSSSLTGTAAHQWMMGGTFDFETNNDYSYDHQQQHATCAALDGDANDDNNNNDNDDQPQLRYALEQQQQYYDEVIENSKEEHVDYSSPPAAPLAFPTPTIHLAQKCHGNHVPYLDHQYNNIVVSDADQTILIPLQGPQEQAYLFKKALTKSSFGAIHVCIVLKRRPQQQQETQSGENECEQQQVDWVSTDQLVVVKVSSWALMLRGGGCGGGGGGCPSPLLPTLATAITSNTAAATTTANKNTSMTSGKKLASHEAAAMQHVGNYHPNVLGCIEVLRDSTSLYTVLPYCPGGDLYRRILGTSTPVAAKKACIAQNLPSEDQARKWFRQLLAGLAHLQKKGVCHAALSLENLLLDQDDNLVIADLGLALRVPYSSPLDDYHTCSNSHHQSCFVGFVDVSDGSGFRRLIQPQQSSNSGGGGGSRRYMAPEALAKNQAFDGYAVDLWSAGVILFVMLVGTAPFRRAAESDSKFVQVSCQGNLKRILAKSSCPRHHELSPEAIDLLQNMLRADPRQRLSLADVMAHPWVVQECSTLQQDNDDAYNETTHPVPSLGVDTADDSATTSTTCSSQSSGNNHQHHHHTSRHLHQIHDNTDNNNTTLQARGGGVCMNHRFFLAKRAVHFGPSVGQKDESTAITCNNDDDTNMNTKCQAQQQQQQQQPCMDSNRYDPHADEKVISSQQTHSLSQQGKMKSTTTNVLQPLGQHHFEV